MSYTTNVLSQIASLEVFEYAGTERYDLKAWLANQNYFLDSQTDSTTIFSLSARDNGFWIGAANDCNRFACAAFETISHIQAHPRLAKSSAWNLIMAYYASFYAMHALLRIFGMSYSQLEKPLMRKVIEIANLSEETEKYKFEDGFYKIKFNKTNNVVDFKKRKDSHSDAWESFLNLTNEILEKVNGTTALNSYKNDTLALISKLQENVTRSRCSTKGNWLSFIRNEVNYQHSRGLWYPFSDRPRNLRILSSCSTAWLESEGFSAILPDNEIEAFAYSCLALVGIST